MKFRTVVIDPPVPFEAWSEKGKGRAPEQHYDTMSWETLASMPVTSVLEDDAIVHLWATYPRLQETLRLISAWGLTFKTVGFTWVKVNTKRVQPVDKPITDNYYWMLGNGYYTRANPEISLLCTYKATPKRLNRGVRNLIVTPLARHSAKPEEMQDRVELLTGGTYLEMFARRQRPGWTCIGYELSGNDINVDLQELASI